MDCEDENRNNVQTKYGVQPDLNKIKVKLMSEEFNYGKNKYYIQNDE